MLKRLLLLSLLLMFALPAVAQDAAPPAQPAGAERGVFQFLSERDEYRTFSDLLENAGLAEMLQGAGSYTVLAVSDAALNNTPQAIIDRMNSDPDFLRQVLETHIIEGEYSLNELQDAPEGSVTSIGGEPYEIDVTAAGLRINGVGFVATRIDDVFSNGVINAVERVVLPVSLMDEF
jgi:uncharacterized surface protein with fasciclin (FAS1) repeats